MGGGNAKIIFALIDFDWTNQEILDTPVKWLCGDPEVDPWEWRMRVLEERTDVAYSKVFFKTSGFITREWYPYFYAVRRNGASFEDVYEQGAVSHTAKRIYDIVRNGHVALHEIKALGGFGKEDKSQFDRAMVELQMGLFITMTGRKQKKNKYGIEYGWNSTVLLPWSTSGQSVTLKSGRWMRAKATRRSERRFSAEPGGRGKDHSEVHNGIKCCWYFVWLDLAQFVDFGHIL